MGTKTARKKKALHVQHTFLVNFSAFVLYDYRNFLVTRFTEEMPYVFLFTFLSLQLMFTLVAASITQFSPPPQSFHNFLPTKLDSFVFYPRSSSFFLCYPRLCRHKNLVERQTGLCCFFFFSLNVRVVMRFFAETRGCLKGGLFRYQRRDKLKPKESTWCGT